MWQWPLRVPLRVFLARMMSDQRKHNQSLHLILYTIPLEASFSILSVWLLKCVRDGANGLMGDLDVETSELILLNDK